MRTTTMTTTKKTDLEFTLASMANAHTRMCKENEEMQMQMEEAQRYIRAKEIKENFEITLAGLSIPAIIVALYFIGCML